MAGCVKHGFMNINAMRSDNALPLNPSATLDHITRTFLNGGVPGETLSQHIDAIAAGEITAGVAPPAWATEANKIGGSWAAAAARVGKGFDPGDAAARAWAEEASEEFPTRRSSEDRIFKICIALTKLMPMNNAHRIRCYNERWG